MKPVKFRAEGDGLLGDAILRTRSGAATRIVDALGMEHDKHGQFARMFSVQINQRHYDAIAERQRRGVDALALKHGMSVPEYQRAVAAKLTTLFADGQVQIRLSPDTLRQVLADGRFKSQFESGTSGGILAPMQRAGWEQQMFDSRLEMRGVDRPIYGYVADRQRDDLNGPLNMYGTVIVWLKDSVLDRTTACVGDSFNASAQPMPVASPDMTIVPPAYLDPDRVVRRYSVDPRDPLEWRSLRDSGAAYIEAQIHGGLKAADIAAVEFAPYGYDIRPGSDVLARLKDEGIPYRDRSYFPQYPPGDWENGQPARSLPEPPKEGWLQ